MGRPSRFSPPSSTALSTEPSESKVTKPMPLNSPVSLSLSQRVPVTVAPDLPKKAEIFSSSIDQGRLPAESGTWGVSGGGEI